MIYRQAYKSWQYSEEVEMMKGALKLAQQAERENGTAKVKSITVSPVARVNASVLADEVAVLVNSIERTEDIENVPEAV